MKPGSASAAHRGHLRQHLPRRAYPFSAMLAQEKMKLALLLNAINPAIGGVVVRGEKGATESTAARGLRELLPLAVDGRRPASVDFPLGATGNMVVGSIDFEDAVRDGKLRFLPGLLGCAHEGALCIDEVNLLDDHLVDSILDVAERDENVVEREGPSLTCLSRFILIGTMDPEEGELQPELLDRFGLAVSVCGEADPTVRVERLMRRGGDAALAKRIAFARTCLPEVIIPAHLTGFISEICLRKHVASYRADLVIARAARAHAAWQGRSDVTADDILIVVPLALLHRMRTGTSETPPPPSPPARASRRRTRSSTSSLSAP